MRRTAMLTVALAFAIVLAAQAVACDCPCKPDYANSWWHCSKPCKLVGEVEDGSLNWRLVPARYDPCGYLVEGKDAKGDCCRTKHWRYDCDCNLKAVSPCRCHGKVAGHGYHHRCHGEVVKPICPCRCHGRHGRLEALRSPVKEGATPLTVPGP